MIDKRKIHKIQDGQKGAEVAENIFQDLNLLADEIISNTNAINGIKTNATKQKLVINVDKSPKFSRPDKDVYRLSNMHTQDKINQYINQIANNPTEIDIFVLFQDTYIKMNLSYAEVDCRVTLTSQSDVGVIFELNLGYDDSDSCYFACKFAYDGMDFLSRSFVSFISNLLGIEINREPSGGIPSGYDYSFAISSVINGEKVVYYDDRFDELFKSFLAYTKRNYTIDNNLTNRYNGEQCFFIPCDIDETNGDVVLKQAFDESSASLIRLVKDKIYVKDMFRAFAYCTNLEAIQGEMYLRDACDIKGAFIGCGSLEHFCISNLNSDLDISSSPYITPSTILHLIQNADKSKKIKIKVNKTIQDAINGTSPKWKPVRDALLGGGVI